MQKFIKKSSILTLVIFAFSTFASEEKKEILLLHTNDIESVYEPLKATWRDDIDYMGGMPFLSTLIKQQKKQVNTSFLFDAGDIYTGALSEKSTGKLPFDLYSAMGYDAVNLGNHEFEYGWKSLVETKPRASFPVLSANIFHKDSGTLIADPYTILEKDGVRIGVVGVMGVDAFHNATATFQREELYIKPPTPIVQYWVDKIKDDVHMVVVLTHQNKTAPMQTNKESDPSVQRGFEEDYAMAGELRDVDVIFGGHSDNGLLEPVVHPKTGIVIGLTFGQGMHLGYMKFIVNTKEKDAKYIEGGLIPVNAGVLAEDKKVSSLIKKQRDIHPSLTEEFAYLKEGALRKYNEESDLGNVLTDIMRADAGSDIAMINSGAIRADLNAGPVTREHILNVYPFIDNLTTVRLTGKQVRELIEYSCTLPYGIGQFSGITLTYDSTLPPKSRIVSLKVGSEDLEESKNYLVSTTGFVASGGDGYSIFTKGTVTNKEKELATVFFDGFKEKGEIVLPQRVRQKDLANQ